ncbi:PAS/PAC sensor hybrid histidine kinase [Paraglaciecola sp. T6c]|uniref:ATP-binding protein n=1 Tax=Pseudoalteromonas atlantica (strain T6c / ATCC BAA-1087) TaxID=3042615 RepID=UPI00005C661F|nr:ATP-binding protein [Paraglaciecola sp. T6c]ABG40622.1 PAS/PAC sensor hybrid histidine kinase [Paraglaciecola sp. T6c]
MAQAIPPLRSQFKFHKHVLPITLVAILLLLASAVAVFEFQLSQSVTDELKSTLSAAGDQINAQAQEDIENYRQDLRFLHATPPVSGLPRALEHNGVDPLDNTTSAQWRQRLEMIFSAFLTSNPEYDQIRVISADKSAMELVRVDRVAGNIEVVSPEQLQSKRASEYAQKSAALSEGEIYMSRISLNKEYGKLDYPYRPMLRLSLPIFDDSGKRFGFLIVNINTLPLFSSLSNTLDSPNFLTLTDSDGFFLITPDEQYQYSHDLSPEFNWNSVFSVTENISHRFAQIRYRNKEGDVFYVLDQKVTLNDDVDGGFLQAKLIAPARFVHAIETTRRTTVYAFLFSATIVMLIVLAFFNRSANKSKQLADARAESAAIVSASKDAIISVDLTGRVKSWNNAAKGLLSLSAVDVIGKTLMELRVFDDIELSDIFERLSNKHRQLNIETQIESQENSPIFLALSFSPIANSEDRIEGIAIIARDVTQERIADEKIKQANAELEEKVALRTVELQKASGIKSAFISNISHEMRTPLNGIIGTLNLVKREHLSENQQRYIEMTEVSVNTLSTLVNDVLDLSKIEAGKLDLDIKPFNPVNLIESLCGSMAVKAQEKGLEFIIDVSALNYQSMVSDPHRFSQILTNLVNNAIKFTETGYIKVSAHTELVKDKVHLHCAIADSGEGIAKENQDKLFSAFSQADSSVASKHGGTGLGLSICRQLVTLLKGEVNFTSQKNQGSVFYFSISADANLCQLSPPSTCLANISTAVFIEHKALYQSTCQMIEALGGTITPAESFDKMFAAEMPSTWSEPRVDYIVIDQQHPDLMALDDKWLECIAIDDGSAKVVLLKRDGEPTAWLKNIKPTVLTKPILRTEFLQKVTRLNTNSSSIEAASVNRPPEINGQIENPPGDFEKIKGARVLVVDDNEINVEVAKGVLSRLPVTLLQATNGKEALQQLILAERRNEVIHCVLMDCQMPIMNGYEASQRIRKGEVGELYKNIPIIAMTANAMLGERNKCLSAGMDDYLTKPVNEDIMQEKVTKWTLSVYQAPQR